MSDKKFHIEMNGDIIKGTTIKYGDLDITDEVRGIKIEQQVGELPMITLQVIGNVKLNGGFIREISKHQSDIASFADDTRIKRIVRDPAKTRYEIEEE